MSRKGVITKRVKTAPDGSIENQRPTAQSGWPRKRLFPLGQITSVRLKSRPKFQTDRPITHHDPGNIPRSAKPQPPRHAAHDHAARAGNKPRGRATLAYHGRCIRPSRENVPRPAEKPSAKSHPRPTTPADRESSGHDRSDSPTTRLSGRSSRPTVPTPRSTRSPF
ncbi:unnamed protein product [Microthlaspi erraticum]|uniref:Uncharacterized protein n=1 Tax=Microthlaspi erraticum TaxID=1685480 RepID=A0A6D2JF30_9BRAS|nr:unnamed protein product [Microthlaspi erraticum]